MSSNLPPGCRVSDIPGNRPEDEAWDAFWDRADLFLYLLDWASRNNRMLHAVLCKVEDRDDAETIARDIADAYSGELPIMDWFEDWMEAGRERCEGG